MNQPKRTALLNKLRQFLVKEGLADGLTREEAEAYATQELKIFAKPINGKPGLNNRALRLAASAC